MVFFYEIAPADRSYLGDKLLTYSYGSKLEVGQIVVVKLRSKPITGFIVKKVKKPAFDTKIIDQIHEAYKIPEKNVKFFEALNAYYPGSLGSTAGLFVPKTIINDKKIHKSQGTGVEIKTSIKHTLTKEQSEAYNEIAGSSSGVHILHGDTGTGKTRVYLELCINYLSNGKSVIILTPEIGLTPQMREQFLGITENIFVIHSQLTSAERRNIWLEISRISNKPCLIIGPRSAMFSPVNNLGLIVIDEFHDNAYKQDQSPRFQTVRVASILSKLTNSKLLLGSATPPIEDFFYATQKGAQVHRLTKLPNNLKVSRSINLVHMSDDSEQSGYSLLSKSLLSSIKKTLKENGQVMLFLNKRGSQRTLFCEECGWIAKCDRCNIPYVYHHDVFALICHTCYKKSSVPVICNDCGSPKLQFKNPGTKQIEADIRKIFSKARIGRYDKDNTKSESLLTNQSAISAGKIDILIGTQMLTKGHDLPKLKLVGILNSDSGLQFPDYSSSERNFQTIWQVIGRVGRVHGHGEVIVQTFSKPEKVQKYFEQKTDTWRKFYDKELLEREKYSYPPFVFMLKLEMSRKSEEVLAKNIDELADKIRKSSPKVEVIGPAPSIKSLKNGYHYWQLIIKSKNRTTLREIIAILPKNCSYDLDPINLL